MEAPGISWSQKCTIAPAVRPAASGPKLSTWVFTGSTKSSAVVGAVDDHLYLYPYIGYIW